MNLIDLIVEGKLKEAKELVYLTLSKIAGSKIEELKPIVSRELCHESKIVDESSNVVKMGRIQKIRRRIRRNKKGRIIVQRNIRRSAVKGYRLSGSKVIRISAMQRINKTRKLKRYWKTKGRARLTRTLMKRKMSLQRRKGMGIR